ncbi:uncharacterized protein EI97DRAFT_65125 [Westerdykella ornata]|uniref:Uncharacterized protein n=1 Tax=Westerdykella ornata TaxID=318751 RepID=A0A6A6JHC2_WESOR|nr:uncharacterized protein EI97DRAFT_65125 [Westerdykella ornata]KAF2275604.1 hypothetical protein EI97DRAFT_65125 [Westerdykella ornata]
MLGISGFRPHGSFLVKPASLRVSGCRQHLPSGTTRLMPWDVAPQCWVPSPPWHTCASAPRQLLPLAAVHGPAVNLLMTKGIGPVLTPEMAG